MIKPPLTLRPARFRYQRYSFRAKPRQTRPDKSQICGDSVVNKLVKHTQGVTTHTATPTRASEKTWYV